MVRARTCEEKIESDDYGEKRGEPEGIIEIEVTHEEVSCTQLARTQLASGTLAPTLKFIVVYVIQHAQRCTISSRVSMNI